MTSIEMTFVVESIEKIETTTLDFELFHSGCCEFLLTSIGRTFSRIFYFKDRLYILFDIAIKIRF